MRHLVGRCTDYGAVPGRAAGRAPAVRPRAGCCKRRLGTRTLQGTAQAALIRVHPPITLTKRTRIEVKMVNAAGVSRTARFRFVRRAGGLIALSL